MTEWIRFQTSFPGSPEVLALVGARKHKAIVTFVAGLGYCGQHETGGYIPDGALPLLHGTKREALDLVDAGLWEKGVTGYMVRGWDTYQHSNITAADRAAAGKIAACKRWHAQPCSKCRHVDEPTE